MELRKEWKLPLVAPSLSGLRRISPAHVSRFLLAAPCCAVWVPGWSGTTRLQKVLRPKSRSCNNLKASSYPTMLRPCLPRAGNLLKSSRRGLRTLPMLRHNFSDGVPGLLSPAGFDMAWTQYQSLMIEKLNTLTAGMRIYPLSHISLPGSN